MGKGKWGGIRPGNPNKRRGGARPGSGPMVRRLQLDAEAARKLRVLVLNRRSITGQQAFSEVDLVTGLINAAYAEYDAAIQEAVEMVEDANV